MSTGYSPFAADHPRDTHDPYFLTDDDGGTLWQSLGPDDPDPKPLLSRRGSTSALWNLALRGAGLDKPRHETPDPWRRVPYCTCAAWTLGGFQHETSCGWVDDEVRL